MLACHGMPMHVSNPVFTFFHDLPFSHSPLFSAAPLSPPVTSPAQALSHLNALNQDQHTALFCAAEQGHSDVVVTLLQEGAAVDLQDGDGRLALHW